MASSVCVDEFTFALNRGSAQYAATGLGGCLRKAGKWLVVAGVHVDILDCLQLDRAYHTGEKRLVVFTSKFVDNIARDDDTAWVDPWCLP